MLIRVTASESMETHWRISHVNGAPDQTPDISSPYAGFQGREVPKRPVLMKWKVKKMEKGALAREHAY